jgi:putative ABC transport system permease protein
MMTTIIGAVFFTIILLTANTMVQAFRERTGEFAVLKTLGFRDSQVLLMVLGEGVLLCVLGGLLGLGLALLAANAFGPTLSQFVGIFEITSSTIALSIALAVGLGVFVSTLPALAAKRLTIVEALRGH